MRVRVLLMAASVLSFPLLAAPPVGALNVHPWCSVEVNGFSTCVDSSLAECERRLQHMIECRPNPNGEID
jgi:hypothetical protein